MNIKINRRQIAQGRPRIPDSIDTITVRVQWMLLFSNSRPQQWTQLQPQFAAAQAAWPARQPTCRKKIRSKVSDRQGFAWRLSWLSVSRYERFTHCLASLSSIKWCFLTRRRSCLNGFRHTVRNGGAPHRNSTTYTPFLSRMAPLRAFRSAPRSRSPR